MTRKVKLFLSVKLENTKYNSKYGIEENNNKLLLGLRGRQQPCEDVRKGVGVGECEPARACEGGMGRETSGS